MGSLSEAKKRLKSPSDVKLTPGRKRPDATHEQEGSDDMSDDQRSDNTAMAPPSSDEDASGSNNEDGKS